LISVESIFFSGSKSLFIITTEAFVEYKKRLYLGLERKVKAPLLPSSILAILEIYNDLANIIATLDNK
jgi:hypothetical protein